MINWGNGILDLASNIYWVIGIFVVFTFLLHVFFVFLFPLSLRAWKLVDYVWLTLAFLSVMGLVGEAKQYRAENTLRESELQAIQSLNNVRNWYSNYQIYICEEVKILKNKKQEDANYSALCNWFEERINDLNLIQKNEEQFPFLPATLQAGLGDYGAIIPRLEQKILSRRLDQYAVKRKQHLSNIEDAKRSFLQQIMLILAPVMFAMALAIRFTKVTAEYRLLRPRR